MSKKGSNDNVKVMVRVRPFNSKEIKEANEAGLPLPVCTLQCQSDTMISCINPCNENDIHSFPFDWIAWSMPPEQVSAPIDVANQLDVYEHGGLPSLESAFEGYHGCIFAYGQTSSGKTHSMMGYEGHGRGITPRLCEDLFTRIAAEASKGSDVQTTVTVSFMEIYNEKVLDLLGPRKGKGHSFDTALQVIHDPQQGPIVKGLTLVTATNWKDVEAVFDQGQSNRSTAATEMNDRSSRSHAIVQLSMSRMELYGKVGTKEVRREKRSRINLVDLAGSEKILKSGVTGSNLKEAIGINQSLTCLGRVIDMLVQQKPHVPYRDSVLTSLLSDSLGGNSRTTMLAALSPAACNYEETLSTLRWASRARQVVNVVKVNMDPAQMMIQQLQEELAKYKQALFEGVIAPDIQQKAMESGKPLNTVLIQNQEETEAIIENLKKKEAEEEMAASIRAKKWEEERLELKDKHSKDVTELKEMHQELLKEKEDLEIKHQEVQKKGIMERFKRLGLASRMQEQQVKQEQMQEKIKQERVSNIVQRIRETSLKVKVKGIAEDLTSAQLRIKELEEQNSHLQEALLLAQAAAGARPGEFENMVGERHSSFKLGLRNVDPNEMQVVDANNMQQYDEYEQQQQESHYYDDSGEYVFSSNKQQDVQNGEMNNEINDQFQDQNGGYDERNEGGYGEEQQEQGGEQQFIANSGDQFSDEPEDEDGVYRPKIRPILNENGGVAYMCSVPPCVKKVTVLPAQMRPVIRADMWNQAAAIKSPFPVFPSQSIVTGGGYTTTTALPQQQQQQQQQQPLFNSPLFSYVLPQQQLQHQQRFLTQAPSVTLVPSVTKNSASFSPMLIQGQPQYSFPLQYNNSPSLVRVNNGFVRSPMRVAANY